MRPPAGRTHQQALGRGEESGIGGRVLAGVLGALPGLLGRLELRDDLQQLLGVNSISVQVDARSCAG
jgi:hypothetical protein